MDLQSEKQFNQTPIENFETADSSNQGSAWAYTKIENTHTS